MRLQLFLLCLTIFQLQASPLLSQQLVTISVKNVPIEEVIREVERQSGYAVVYNNNQLQAVPAVTVQRRDASALEVLNAALSGTGLECRMMNDLLVISKAARQAQPQPAQPRKVEGRVTDRKGNPVIGAAVVLKGTQTGTATDHEGRFVINAAGPNPVLSVTYLGMQPREVAVTGAGPVEIVLDEAATDISEVVVTGIFTKSRESYTGAATTITAAELRQFGNRNVLRTIGNIDPSFNIADNIEFGSDPNRLPDITVRGRSSMDVSLRDLQTDSKTQSTANLPLFILDGFEVGMTNIMDIDDSQIESITLLKDASATAMYGTRGANGVVVITTKRPETGKLQITYKGDLTIEAPDLSSYDLMNAREKLQYEVAANFYQSYRADNQQDYLRLYNKRLTDIERGVDTYWLKYPVRTGIGHRHSLRLEGGDKTFRYAASVGYNSVAGAMKGSNRDTFNGSILLSYRLRNVTFQNTLSVSFNRANNSPYGNFATYAKMNPYWKPYDDEGNLVRRLETERYAYMGGDISVMNPLYRASLPSKNSNGYDNVMNNFSIEWQIAPNLTLRGRLGLTRQTGRSDVYLPSQDPSFDKYPASDFDRKGTYDYGTSYLFTYDADVTLNYAVTLNEKHAIYAGMGYNVAETKTENYSVTGEGYANVNMDFLGMGSYYQRGGAPGGTEGISRRIGGLANINYTYAQKYFADLSGRVEGSSKFGSNNRIAPFWSVGVGWNIHNEKFFGNSDMVKLLRLRLSYGITGSQEFDPYQSMTTFRFHELYYRGLIGAKLMGIGNPDLGWQQTQQTNIGLETYLFNGRFRLNVDFYNKLTNDMLADITLPSASGFATYKANIGKVRNRGVELTAQIYVIRNNETGLVWTVGGSLAHNKNRIMKIANSLDFLNQEIIKGSGNEDAIKDNGVNPSFLYREGQSMNTIFAVRSRGIDPSNGKEIFVKADGTETYTWDGNDQVPCGIAEPKVWGNINTSLRYRNLTLNLLFGYRMGGQVFNSTLVNRIENVNVRDNGDRRIFYDRWKQPGDQTFFKSVLDRTTTKVSSRFVQDERTLELRTVNLSYELNAEWLKRNLGISYLNVGLYAEDIFRASTIKQERGLSYPFARKFSLSLTARF